MSPLNLNAGNKDKMTWLEFGFNAEPNLSDAEIRQLWKNTQYLNNIMNDLASAKLTFDDACALSEKVINPDRLINDLHHNFEHLGYL